MSELRRRRPWLAVLLALVISGLGHAYLRRWARAFGWYAAITAVLILFVPEAAVDQLLARESPPLADIAPGLAVVAASVLDAYVLAVRNNRRYEARDRDRTLDADEFDADEFDADGLDDATELGRPSAGATGGGLLDRVRGRPAGVVDDGGMPGEPASTTVDCPHCGRETDASLDFCHWCTEPLETRAE